MWLTAGRALHLPLEGGCVFLCLAWYLTGPRVVLQTFLQWKHAQFLFYLTGHSSNTEYDSYNIIYPEQRWLVTGGRSSRVFITIVEIWGGEWVGIAFLCTCWPSESCDVEADLVVQTLPLVKGEWKIPTANDVPRTTGHASVLILEKSLDWAAESGKASPIPSARNKPPGEGCVIVKNWKQVSRILCLVCNAILYV